MGFLDWARKGIDTEEDLNHTTSNDKDAHLEKIELDEEERKRKEAFIKLTNGENPLKSKTPEPQNSSEPQNSPEKKTIKVYGIKSNDDLMKIYKILQTGEPLILSLKKVDKKEQQRVIDFLSGMTFGLEAHISMLVSEMYLVTPKGAKIS